ncbi:GntR family transcriptional regulator [Microbacterium paraoxydans]|uniref:GntR family transcriptional regulator n=1 Tax=Microbacterium paraoxydans TaxID=199592 RepID=UPI001CFA034C|nr:GntR family transcriptional regulator [Microbacterium paraoxydans]
MRNTGSGSTNFSESKQLLADEVFRHIGSQIVRGTLTEGERIRDVEVAEELHVSRTPVREALQRLERLGMVMMYPSRYTEVTSVTAETEAQSLVFAGCQAGIAARLAVPRLSTTQREHVVRLVAAMCATLDDGAKTSEARWAVFSYLGEHCGNSQHRALMEDASMALLRNLRNWKIVPTDRERMRQLYLDFGEAVADGEGERAEGLVRSMHYL